jgi:hypothetical protein
LAPEHDWQTEALVHVAQAASHCVHEPPFSALPNQPDMQL